MLHSVLVVPTGNRGNKRCDISLGKDIALLEQVLCRSEVTGTESHQEGCYASSRALAAQEISCKLLNERDIADNSGIDERRNHNPIFLKSKDI